ncbi:MAG: hypothetical protein ACRDSL_14790 [Pseudonocardiaceae bacterium]
MPSLVRFDVDRTAHEGARPTAVLDGPDQQAGYDLLIAEGVLPETVGWPR